MKNISKVRFILPNLTIMLAIIWNKLFFCFAGTMLCLGKWGQRTVFVLELVPNIGVFAWATGTSLHSREKNVPIKCSYMFKVSDVYAIRFSGLVVCAV